MEKNKNSWIIREMTYLFLAPFLALTGVLLFGILFNKWIKDPVIILEYSGIAYGILLILRFFGWTIRSLSR